MAIAAVYLFVILPMVAAFDMLTLVFAPIFLVLGALIAMPATNFSGMVIAVNVASLLSISDVYNADFTAYANNALATVVGMAAAATLTRIVRSVGAVWSARRLMRANRRDIARVASHRGTLDQATLTALILDRLCELVPRLAASVPHADRAAAAALVDLRTGLNVVHLQRDSAELPAEAHAAIDRDAGWHRRIFPRPRTAARRMTHCAATSTAPSSRSRSRPARVPGNLLLELVGIRHNLFPDAPPYRAGSASSARAA